jgi:serine/threonine protein kinase
LRIYILKSSNTNYIENKYKKITVIKKLGEGSYGLVYLLNNDHVIKIFKNSTNKNTILNESNYLIPIKNENRELIFYYKYIDEKKENNYIINLYAIGLIKDNIIDMSNDIELNSYFIILPLCTSFYNTYDIYNVQLINKNNGINFTLNIMKRLIQISDFLEDKYNIVNLDFKLNNFMFKNKSNDLDNLVMLDFSITKKKTKIKYNIDNKYYIWPDCNNMLIENMPSYSTCINGLELLFGHKNIINIRKDKKIDEYLKIIKGKDKNAYNIFFHGLILKINTENFLKLF